MTEPTDERLPATAADKTTRLRGQQKRLLARWNEYLRRQAGAASALDPQTLANSFPAWLELLIEGLATKRPRRDDLRKVAREHGEHRAQLREYTVRDLLTEYLFLRRLVFEALEEEGPLSAADREYILGLFEEDSIEAVSAFLSVHAARSQGLLAKAEEAGNLLGEVLAESEDGIAVIDREWRIIYLNRQAFHVLSGGAVEADLQGLLGKHLWDVPLPGVESKLSWSQLEVLEKKKPVHYERFLVEQDRFLQVRVFPIERGLTIYFRDISEARRCMNLLHQSEDRFHHMVEAIKDYAIFMLDPQGHVTSWNLGAERLKQYKAEEIIGHHFRELYLPEDAQAGRPEQNLRRALIKGRTEDEWWRRKKDGSRFWANVLITTMFDETGGLKGFVKVIRDLTERRRAEEEQQFLTKVMATLSTSLEHTHLLTQLTGLLIPGHADWCLIELRGDPRFEGYRVAHKDPTKLPALEELQQRYAPFLELPDGPEKVLRTGTSVFVPTANESTILAFAKDARHAELLKTVGLGSLMTLPLQARGRILGSLTLVATVPGRYTARDLAFAEELNRRVALFIDNTMLYEDARKALDMREVLAVVSHDLRAPLSNIAASTLLVERLAQKQGDAEAIGRHLKSIRRSGDRMMRLIEDLLDLSRIEAGQFQLAKTKFDAHGLVREAVELFQSLAAEKQIRVEVQVDGGDVLLCADRDRVLQVLSNLLGNALKFTPQGGSIAIGFQSRADDVCFWVRDTGSGIAPEDLSRIFARFWQSKDHARLGMGLGLSIAKAIAELHGGSIWAESRPGEGALFQFTLPKVGEASCPTPLH